MANTSSVPSLGQINGQISAVWENLFSLYGTRSDLEVAGRVADLERITIDIEKWERRVEQLEAARKRMRAAAEVAAAQVWAEAQASWSHAASVA